MLGSTSVLIHTRIFQAQPPLPAQLLTQVWGSGKLILPRARGIFGIPICQVPNIYHMLLTF